jgi:glucose-6-phosphate isomerase
MDKIVTFIAVENLNSDLPIPKAYDNYDSIEYLGGHTLKELFDAERRATELSLTLNNRLNCTVCLPRINGYTLGQLFYFFEVSIVFLGQLYKVNPLDQPGVEESKNYARALMGRKGYENKRAEIANLIRKSDKYCF